VESSIQEQSPDSSEGYRAEMMEAEGEDHQSEGAGGRGSSEISEVEAEDRAIDAASAAVGEAVLEEVDLVEAVSAADASILKPVQESDQDAEPLTEPELETETQLEEPVPESEEDEDLDDEGVTGGEDWKPPEMYAHVDENGMVTMVDKDGNPISSPPVYTKVVDEKGQEQIVAYYPGMDPSNGFTVKYYTSSLEDVYAHHNSDGSVTIVDQDGNPIKGQPQIYKTVNEKGVEIIQVGYPGTSPDTWVEVSNYKSDLTGVSAHVDSSGKVTFVDSEGNPIESPPVYQKVVDENGMETILACYPDGENNWQEVGFYSGSTSGLYAHFGSDGSVTVVDENGKPVNCQPVIVKTVDETGVETVSIYYPGQGAKNAVQLEAYSASVKDCKVHFASDGTTTVVDANGKPIDSPPQIYKTINEQGVEEVYAAYPGGEKVKLDTFSTSLDNLYCHVGQGGKVTVVDENGKAIDSPPQITKIVDQSGMEQYIASYPGGKKVVLSNYIPPYKAPESNPPAGRVEE